MVSHLSINLLRCVKILLLLAQGTLRKIGITLTMETSCVDAEICSKNTSVDQAAFVEVKG